MCVIDSDFRSYPCSSPVSTTVEPGNDAPGNQREILAMGKKVSCLVLEKRGGSRHLSAPHTTEKDHPDPLFSDHQISRRGQS